jgi:hypothetical protein
MSNITEASSRRSLRRHHTTNPNIIERVAGSLGLAAFTVGPALLLVLATDGVLLPLVWFLASDAIGAAIGVMLYRRSVGYLWESAVPAVGKAASNRLVLKNAA